jgi:hypothetical protein
VVPRRELFLHRRHRIVERDVAAEIRKLSAMTSRLTRVLLAGGNAGDQGRVDRSSPVSGVRSWPRAPIGKAI